MQPARGEVIARAGRRKGTAIRSLAVRLLSRNLDPAAELDLTANRHLQKSLEDAAASLDLTALAGIQLPPEDLRAGRSPRTEAGGVSRQHLQARAVDLLARGREADVALIQGAAEHAAGTVRPQDLNRAGRVEEVGASPEAAATQL